MWCPLRNGFTQLSASCRMLCNNIVTWHHCIETRLNTVNCCYSTTENHILNIETVAVISTVKGEVNAITLFICILILIQYTEPVPFMYVNPSDEWIQCRVIM